MIQQTRFVSHEYIIIKPVYYAFIARLVRSHYADLFQFPELIMGLDGVGNARKNTFKTVTHMIRPDGY